jgi:hypothetical protein
MDFISFGIASGVFTLFGYIWGRFAAPPRTIVELIVGSTMDKLEKDGYLKSQTIDGETHYIKWPSHSEKDL